MPGMRQLLCGQSLQTGIMVQILTSGLPTNQHAVFVWVPSILNDWNDVGAFLCHIEKITTRAMGELHSIDQPFL